MRGRSREVNIFNMSLLDILTGMLGAFLFLMLGLVPYYTKAKNSNSNGGGGGPQTPPVDMTLNIISRTDTTSKADFFLHGPDGWHGSNKKSVPLSSRAKILNGACPNTDSWQMSSAYVSAGNRYLMCISPQGPTDPEALRNVRFSVEMMEAQSATDGSGMKSYYPDTIASMYDASGAKPGNVYGVAWIDVTKDTSKSADPDDYNHQYDYTYTEVKPGDSLPDGALPLPPPAPVSAIPFPSPGPTPAPSPSPSPGPTPHDEPQKSSSSSFFNWFHHATPPPSQNKNN